MIEMAKAYDLNVYKYLNFLLEKRPNARTAQKELEKLAPWNEEVQKMFASEYSYAAEPPVQFRLSHLSRRSEPL